MRGVEIQDQKRALIARYLNPSGNFLRHHEAAQSIKMDEVDFQSNLREGVEKIQAEFKEAFDKN